MGFDVGVRWDDEAIKREFKRPFYGGANTKFSSLWESERLVKIEEALNNTNTLLLILPLGGI
jgi:hypothetical protein